MTIAGEAAARLSPELKRRYPAIPWQAIIAMRNFLVHEYFGLAWQYVWQTAVDDAPALRRQIAELLEAAEGQSSGATGV